MSRVQGVDVSYVQRNAVDWNAVERAGFRFAFIKATEGNGGRDPAFLAHVAGAKAAGLHVGAYAFARPSADDQDAARELENLFGMCEGLGTEAGDLPPVLDLESTKLAGDDTLSWVETWVWLAHEYWGRWPVLYTGAYFWEGLGARARGAEWVRNCPLWLAQYPIDYRKSPERARTYEPGPTAAPRVPQPWLSWDLWQYSGNGGKPVPGVRVDCDRNVFNGDYDAFCKRLVLADTAPFAT